MLTSAMSSSVVNAIQNIDTTKTTNSDYNSSGGLAKSESQNSVDKESEATRSEASQNEMQLEKRNQELKILLMSNEEILAKLEAVRETRAYEVMKYETIKNMHPSKVGEYLRSELRHPTAIKQPEIFTIRQKFRKKAEDRAATVLQNYFRQLMLRKKSKNRCKWWNAEDPQQRVNLIEEISERLSKNTAPCRADLTIIKLKLKECKQNRSMSAAAFEQRETTMNRLEKSLKILNQHYR